MHAKGHCSRRGASSAWILTGIWVLMCLYVYLRGLWECWACVVYICLCAGKHRHTFVVWCEPVCPGVCVIV